MPKRRDSKEQRILLDIDNPTRNQISKTFKQRASGVIVPTNPIDKDYCEGCGRQYLFRQRKIWFGQIFCAECVDAWSGQK